MKYTWQALAAALAVVVITWLLWAARAPTYIARLLVDTFLFATLGQVVNLTNGMLGQVFFGPAMFFGMGAYTAGLLSTQGGINPYAAGLAAIGLTAVFGLLVGYLLRSISGHYFGLATIASSLILLQLTNHFIDFTGGPHGLSLPLLGQAPAQFQFNADYPFVLISGLLAVATVLLVAWIRHTPLGLQARAMKDGERAAVSLGINAIQVKMTIMALAAAVGAAVGVVRLQYHLLIEPETAFGVETNVVATLLPIAGGLGHPWAPVVAALILRPAQSLLRGMSYTRFGMEMLLYGIVVIAIIMLLRDGILGLRWPRRQAAKGRTAHGPGA